MWTKLLSLLVLLSFLPSCQSHGKTTARPQGCGNLVATTLVKSMPPGCFPETTRKVVKSLMKIIDRMRAALPDHNPSHKLLKKFPISKKKKKNLTVISEILEMYSNYVFNNSEYVFNKLDDSQIFMAEFHRLKNDVNHCEQRICDSCPQICEMSPETRTAKNLKKLEKKFMKLDQAGVHKAVWEFKSVLLMMAV